MEPVTRPDKIVTDPLVKRQLERGGIDYRFVEFTDYGKRGFGIGPFMKGYKDLKSGVRIAVASGLPMCNALGQMIEPIWTLSGGLYLAPYNLFDTTVDKARVTLVCQADQPNGVKVGAGVTYHPQLFIGGSEVHPKTDNAQLLEVDPINSNYLYNTVEWTYSSIATHRIRTIQGRYRDKFFILAHPHGRVSVKNNCIGDLKLKLGRAVDAIGRPLRVTVIGDEEIIEASEFDRAVFPVEIGASLTVYPDADPESTSVDGRLYIDSNAAETWAAIHDDDGTHARCYSDDVGTAALTRCDKDNTSGTSFYIERCPLLFDTSALGASANISATVLSLYGSHKLDGQSDTVGIVQCVLASNTAIVVGDYDGFTVHEDTACATKTFANWIIVDPYWNDFTFDATGRGWVSKTSITKLATRSLIDYSETTSHLNPPTTSQSYVGHYTADQGTGYKPKLVITYSILFVPRVAGIV